MKFISCFERGLRGKRINAYPCMLSVKLGSIGYPFYNAFGMTRSGIEPMTSRSGADAIPTLLYFKKSRILCVIYQNICKQAVIITTDKTL